MAAGLLAGSCAVLSLPQSPTATTVWISLVAGVLAAAVTRRAWLLTPGLGCCLAALQLQASLDQRLDPALEG